MTPDREFEELRRQLDEATRELCRIARRDLALSKQLEGELTNEEREALWKRWEQSIEEGRLAHRLLDRLHTRLRELIESQGWA